MSLAVNRGLKRLLLALLLCSGGLNLSARDYAAPADTSNTRFRPSSLIAPLTLTGIGALGLTPWWEKNINIPVNDWVHGIRGPHETVVDDVLQYLPLLASVGLSLHKDYHEGWQDRIVLAATAFGLEVLIINGIKYSVCETRPDGSAADSFPSGHTATAFAGAELIRMEYGGWIGAAAYTAAAATAVLRVYNGEHWCNDVLAGAGLGILCAKAAFWLLPLERRALGKVSFLPYFATDPKSGATPALALLVNF